MVQLKTSIVISVAVVAVAGLFAVTGCDTWKRADGQVGRTLALHVNTRNVGEHELISIQSRRSAVLIDQAGARLVDYHLGRRPRWILEVDSQSPDGQRARQLDAPTQPNVLIQPGWRTACDRCDPALDRDTYWQIEATTNQVVLLSDSIGGLRWRKTFHLDEFSGELFIDVALQNTSFHPMKISAMSLISARGELKGHDDTQRAWADGMWLSRRLVGGPPLQSRQDAGRFEFVEQTIPPGKNLSWGERWWITTDATGTRPAEPIKSATPTSRPSDAEGW